jgi:predicted CXXCH cytochrome family protein
MSSKVKTLILIFTFFICLIPLSGCSPSTRYKVLSFFFDGVPDPDMIEGAVSMDWKKRGREGKGERQRVGEHGPFAAKMCDGCHKRGSNELILPIEKLCLNCHNLQIEKRLIHGPVIAGGCRICHEPHGSGQPYLLVSESERFCFYCHNERSVLKNPVHEGPEIKCTDCHDAHASDNEYLLK